jgi:hypothetical protein
MQPVSAERALELISSKSVPPALTVKGRLALTIGHEWSGQLPETLHVTALDITNCTNLNVLPKTLRCFELTARNSTLESFPQDWQIEFRLDLSNCRRLKALPEGLTVGSLILRDCTVLNELPERLTIKFLDISGCTNLRRIPESVVIQHGSLIASGCTQLISVPSHSDLAVLNIEGCHAIRSLPNSLKVHARLDVGGSGLTYLPPSLQNIEIYWRNVLVNYEIAFRPETITAQRVMAEANVEVRRVMLERMGYQRFIAETQAEELDHDLDAGGVRRLWRIALPHDEPLVCVSYLCPSTARHYITRVPPTIQSCRQAVAWIAGFDNPDDYQVIAEA